MLHIYHSSISCIAASFTFKELENENITCTQSSLQYYFHPKNSYHKQISEKLSFSLDIWTQNKCLSDVEQGFKLTNHLKIKYF